jgi:hypothetical protein
LLPFHRTVEPEIKLLPFTVKLNAGVPVIPDDGESEAADGTGFGEVVDVAGADDGEPPQPASPRTAINEISGSRCSIIRTSAFQFCIVEFSPTIAFFKFPRQSRSKVERMPMRDAAIAKPTPQRQLGEGLLETTRGGRFSTGTRGIFSACARNPCKLKRHRHLFNYPFGLADDAGQLGPDDLEAI